MRNSGFDSPPLPPGTEAVGGGDGAAGTRSRVWWMRWAAHPARGGGSCGGSRRLHI